MEGLKVYDKAENGTMLAAELAHVLLSLGMVLKHFFNLSVLLVWYKMDSWCIRGLWRDPSICIHLHENTPNQHTY